MKLLVLFLIAVLTELVSPAFAVSVSTVNYNVQRTNANLSETQLNTTNVTGLYKVGTYTLDGKMYAQPLVIDGVNFGGTTRVVIAVTMNNTIYCFDALRPGTAAIWSVHIGAALTTYPAFTDGFLYSDTMGILSTPTVDTSANVVYFVGQLGTGIWTYALNLADGTNFHAPVAITGSSSASGSAIAFDPVRHLQRTGLLLFGGSLYFAFAGYGDLDPYQGWVAKVDATTLAVSALYVDAPMKGGIWHSGGGISTDGTSLFMIGGTGEGTDNGTTNMGECVFRLNTSLVPQDYMLRADWAAADAADNELGSTHAMIVGTQVMGGSKDGYFWVLNKDALGSLEGSGPAIVQKWRPNNAYGLWAGMAFANNNLYLLGLNSTLNRYAYNGTTFTTTSAAGAGPFGAPNGSIAYTSNGSTAGTAILWAVTNQGFSFHNLVAGTLLALDASTLSVLYSSDTVVGDALGNVAKFAVPTIANGQVFVPTFSNTLVVYGIPTIYSSVTGGVSTIGGTGTLK